MQVPVLELHRLLGHRQRQHCLQQSSCRSGACYNEAAKHQARQGCSAPQLTFPLKQNRTSAGPCTKLQSLPPTEAPAKKLLTVKHALIAVYIPTA